MVFIPTSTSNHVGDEVKRYIADIRKEMSKSFEDKFRSLKSFVGEKLKTMDEKIARVENVSVPEKCEEYIKERMMLVKELEKAVQANDDETEELRCSFRKFEKGVGLSDKRDGYIQNLSLSLKKAEETMIKQSELIGKLEWTINNLKEDMCYVVESHEKLDKKVCEINADLFEVEDRMDGHDQYTRRNSLLIHGLKDVPRKCSEKKFVEYAARKVNELVPTEFELSPFLIDTAHVLATKKRNNHSKVIIIKFKLRWMRNRIIEDFENYFYQFNRGILISEHLCDQKKFLLKKCREVLGKNNVWTEQGVVYGLFNRKKHSIRSVKHLETLFYKQNSSNTKQE